MLSARTLYVCDLDGTLLRPDGSLSPHTRATVNALIAAGGLFTYATARSFFTASRMTGELDLRVPVITYGGAVIVDPRNGVALRTASPEVSAVRALLLESAARGLQPIVFALVGDRDRLCWLDEPLNAGPQGFLGQRDNDPRLMPLLSWDQISLDTVFYVTIIGTAPELVRCRDALGPELADCDVILSEDIYAPGQFVLEVTSASATKGAALDYVQTATGASEIVCFGDNLNDVSMFARADRSYAVAGAVDELKQRATAVIGSNAEDAVAAWLIGHTGMMG